jgi:hypothetical protein
MNIMNEIKKIGILGAFDRINYGDLLFPIILRKFLVENQISDGNDILNFSLIETNDMAKCGGVTTLPHHFLFSKKFLPSGSSVIVAGGEVIGAPWDFLKSIIDGRVSRSSNLRKSLERRTLLKGVIENYDKIFLKRNVFKFPFILSEEDFKYRIKVIYNSVGGVNFINMSELDKKYMLRKLPNSTYLSVRDNVTYNNLKSINNIILEPDIVMLMSKYFSKDHLLTLCGEKTRRKIENYSYKYICFQCNLGIGEKNFEEILEQLINLNKQTGMRVVLLPLAKAFFHQDDIILSKIKEKLIFTDFFTDLTIYEMACFIVYSNLFIGTSLHGAITAMAYNIPHVSFPADNKKVASYLATWDIVGQSICSSIQMLTENSQICMQIPLRERVNNTCRLIELAEKRSIIFKHILRS